MKKTFFFFKVDDSRQFHHKNLKIITAVPYLVSGHTALEYLFEFIPYLLGVKKDTIQRSRGDICSSHVYCFRSTGTVRKGQS
jgi:hypothetical protein